MIREILNVVLNLPDLLPPQKDSHITGLLILFTYNNKNIVCRI